jgi:hypothetical protein
VVTNVTRDADMWVGSLRFSSDKKYSFVFAGDMYHPESAMSRAEGEFVSPDKLVERLVRGDKVIQTYTYTRIK